MNYSYAMGIGNAVEFLRNKGFVVEIFGNEYDVSFPKEKSEDWEEFIKNYLELNYWNEYLTDDGVIFIFHLEDGIKRYEVKDFRNDEVLSLCEKLFGGKFKSIKDMLKGNPYYSDKID